MANDLPSIVQAENISGSAPQTAKIPQPPIIPKEGMHGGNASGFVRNRICVRKPSYLAQLVDKTADTVGAAQGAEVAHCSIFPEKSPGLRSVVETKKERADGERIRHCILRKSHHLITVIDPERSAGGSSQCSEGYDFIIAAPKNGAEFWRARERIGNTVV